MALKKTLWSPETCRCVIYYHWDDVDLVPLVGSIVSQCAHHVGLGIEEHFSVLMEESPRKNFTVAKILELAPVTELDIAWVYGADRALNIVCHKLTVGHKASLKTFADTKFGIGKVLFL